MIILKSQKIFASSACQYNWISINKVHEFRLFKSDYVKIISKEKGYWCHLFSKSYTNVKVLTNISSC